jgi:hypothetical protein
MKHSEHPPNAPDLSEAKSGVRDLVGGCSGWIRGIGYLEMLELCSTPA